MAVKGSMTTSFDIVTSPDIMMRYGESCTYCDLDITPENDYAVHFGHGGATHIDEAYRFHHWCFEAYVRRIQRFNPAARKPEWYMNWNRNR